jgi:type I restriction enzyme S subunit
MSEWKTFPLQDVCIKIGSGATPTGGSSAYRSSGISLIRSQNILLGHFSKEGLAFIGEEQASKLNNVKVENGDILINITGDSVARVCKVPKNILPARVNQHVSILRANPSIVNNDYLNFFLRSPNIQETLLSISQFGATRKALTKEILEKFQITLPPLPPKRKSRKSSVT